MSEILIPDFEHCSLQVGKGVATALESFIYENEPMGNATAASFRNSLNAIITEHDIEIEKEVASLKAQLLDMRNCDNCGKRPCDNEYEASPNLDKCWQKKGGEG